MTIESFLTQLCEHCGIESEVIKIGVTEEGEYLHIQLDLPEEETGRFIGFHGETLESLQRILRVVFQEDYAERRISLNINSYREERAERLIEIVRSVAERVLETGETYTFQSFMPSHERYIVHSSLSEIEGGEKLESFSEGEGKSRRLSIRLKRTENEEIEKNAGEQA